MLWVCLPPKYLSHSDLGRLLLPMYPLITAGCPTLGSPSDLCYSPCPFQSLLWDLSSRRRWIEEVPDMGSYPSTQSGYEKGREKDPKREERPGLIKQEKAANLLLPFLLCTFLGKAFLQEPKKNHHLCLTGPQTTAGKWINEKSLREPGLDCKQFPCSLVVEGLS